MKVIAVIPARMAASRFPGKPLADILGLPMIEHVRRRVAMCDLFSEVVVATCDEEIAAVVKRNGGQAIMTADTHVRCTDRVAEAAEPLDADVIVNVQGDEPLLRPEMFGPLLAPLAQDPQLPCANLIAEIRDADDFRSIDVVKTVVDNAGNALYFSREPIPSPQRTPREGLLGYEQLGIIAFRKDFLYKFSELTSTPLEKTESVDMLRAVEHGYKVRMVLTDFVRIGVDTPQDLARAVKMMEKDNLFGKYR
jgi:3-deoxy-manno-octulosonate cytidylyltransferase (CMP-KDO synthetase)